MRLPSVRRGQLAVVDDVVVHSDASPQADGTPYGRRAHVPLLQIVGVVTEPLYLRESTWQADPRCVECGARLIGPDAGGVVTVAGRLRMACRDTCFGAAVLRFQPERARRLALGRFPIIDG